jgi:hypothetical protein
MRGAGKERAGETFQTGGLFEAAEDLAGAI